MNEIKMNLRILLVLSLFLFTNQIWGAVGDHLFVTIEGVRMQFTVISVNGNKGTAMVGYQDDNGNAYSYAIDRSFEGHITIPQTVIYNKVTYTIVQIAVNAFESSNITSVTLPNSIKTIGKRAFANCKQLQSAEIPEGVSGLSEEMFSGCISLKNISLPTTISSLSKKAFYNCSSLESIEMPKVRQIYGYAFYGCSSLNSLYMPNVISFDEYSFCKCSSLTILKLPQELSHIGNCVFMDCTSLSKVYIGCTSRQVSIYNKVFDNIAQNATLYAPLEHLAYYQKSWSKYFSEIRVVVKEGDTFSAPIRNNDISVEAHFLITDGDNLEVMLGDGNESAISTEVSGNVIVPDTVIGYAGYTYKVVGISNDAFNGCSELTSIELSQNNKIIGNAFTNCNSLTTLKTCWRYPSQTDVSDVCFSEVAEHTTLLVPAGTKKRYEDTQEWHGFMKIIEASPISVGDISAQNNSHIDLPVLLRNTEEIAGIQFKLKLPKGVSVVEKNGNPDISLTNRTDGFSGMGRKKTEEDNSYLFVLFSLAGNSIVGNEGEVMNIKLTIDPDLCLGKYDMTIEDVYMATSTFETLHPIDSSSDLTVTDYILGDVNGNGGVDIGDAVSIVNYLVGKESTTFVEKAADTNKNGQIDIGDAVTIVNFLVGKTPSLSRIIDNVWDEREPQ